MAAVKQSIIGDAELTAAAHQIMRAIEHLQDAEGKTRVSNRELCEATKRNRSTVGRALLQLEAHGYISFEIEREIGHWTPERTIWIVAEEAP